jgi:pimeloyl-ACP methyl ester carboxylesterase
MKKIVLLSLLLVSFIACSSGYRYLNSPALSFQNVDYGYDVNYFEQLPKIAFIETGNLNAKKTLVLIHGLASNAGYFREIIPLVSNEFRVIVVDLPGYGKSEKGDFPYGIKWYAEQVRKLIKHLELKNVYLSGHSMGGQIAITYALNWPDELNKLILLSPAGVEPFLPGEGKWLSNVITMTSIIKATDEQIRVNLARNFYEWNDTYEWMVEERVRLAKSKDEFKEFAYTVDRCVDAMIDEPTTASLGKLTVPVSIIYGKHDGLIPNPYLHPGFTSEVFAKVKDVLPNVNLIEIPKAGHMLILEQAPLVAKAIIEQAN